MSQEFEPKSRAETVNELMRRVHRALARSQLEPTIASRSYYSVVFQVPGLISDLTIEGVDVQDLLVPNIYVPEGERMDVLMTLIPHLGDPVLSAAERTMIRGKLGRQVLDFALIAPTPSGRLARLLWAFSKNSEREVGPNTLLVRDASGEYGVRDGVMVGGVYEGTRIDLPMSELLKPDQIVTTRSTAITEIRRLLKARTDQTAYQIFRLLYAMSEWDSSIYLRTLLMPHKRGKQGKVEKLARTLLESRDPYAALYKTLVPFHMAYSDFVTIFGRPERRGNLKQAARNRLINKLYSLPFFE